jgi:hypothetical protein
MRWILGLFLIAHGLVHLAIWLAPSTKNAPFDVHHSPLFGDVGILATLLGVAAGTVFVISGIGYLTGQAWWAVTAVIGAGMSTGLMLLTFTPWWIIGIAINMIIALLSWREISGRT